MEKRIDVDKLREGIFFAIRGGGVRSAGAIGVLRALEEVNIPIKGISGESGSSLIAALFAYGYNSDEIFELFLKYSETITKAAKVYGGRGSIVIEELVNEVTKNTLMKDLPRNCWINACQGSLLKPELYLFSNNDTPDETLGFACSASAGLPVFYGNAYKYIDGKKITLFDGGCLYNPFIPSNIEYPIVYSSFRNDINYQKVIPFLQKPVDAVTAIADVIVTTPVGKYVVTGDNDAIKELVDSGYHQAKKVLCKK